MSIRRRLLQQFRGEKSGMIVAVGRRNIEKGGRSIIREGRTVNKEKEFLTDSQITGEEKGKKDPGSETDRIKSYI